LDLDRREEELTAVQPQPPAAAPAVIQSQWMSR
jgi:hypothetical protein